MAREGKGVSNPGQAEPVTGLGDQAFWLTGLRVTQYQEVDGAVIQQSVRATDVNTLLWSEDGRTFRIAGDLTQEVAIAIAHSLRKSERLSPGASGSSRDAELVGYRTSR